MNKLDDMPAGDFDIVLSLFGSLSFAENPSRVIEQAKSKLRESGKILFSVYSRWSLRRLLTKKSGAVEQFKTRHSKLRTLSAPAHVFSKREIGNIILGAGFSTCDITGMSFFGGLIENPKLWSLDRFLSRSLPNWGHILHVAAENHGNQTCGS